MNAKLWNFMLDQTNEIQKKKKKIRREIHKF